MNGGGGERERERGGGGGVWCESTVQQTHSDKENDKVNAEKQNETSE